MAFDQNSMPKDLRPLNIVRTSAEESRIVNNTTSGIRSPETFANAEGAVPLFYPASVQGSHALGFGQWGPVLTVPVGNVGMSVNSVAGRFGYSPSFGNRIVGNAFDQASNDMAAVVGSSPNSGNLESSEVMTAAGFGSNPNLGKGANGSGTVLVSEEGGEESVSGKKVKFLCSFGGRILPRPNDGVLRYVGGQTRIISVRKGVSFNELVQKMVDIYGQPVVIKYQLPDEDLDALVLVSCPEDLDNMMEEYEKLAERSPDGSAKLRLFLFSASELDACGLVQLGDLHDGGQRYLDAVNGVMDGLGSGIARKESMASATSTQNSDFSGNEAVDSSGPVHLDTMGPPSMSRVSSTGHVPATFHDSTLKLPSDPTPPVYADASAVSLGVPRSVAIQTHPEVEVERSEPVSLPHQQLSCDNQSGGIGVPPVAPQLQTYMDHHQPVGNLVDFSHFPPQMGFPNAQLLGTSGPVFSQQQMPETNTGISHQHYAPAVHMTMTPPPSHVTIRPNVVPPLIHPQQARLESYSDERAFGTRIVQVPVEPSYNAYMGQLPPPVLGGGYGWHPVPQPQHLSQQVAFPDKILRLEECYMCQKALPHAHSDSLVQDQRESGISSLSDSNSAHQSLLPADTMRGHVMNGPKMAGVVGEGNLEQGMGAQSATIKHVDPQVQTPQSEGILFSQNLENCGQPKISVPQSMMGLPGIIQSHYGMLSGAIPHSHQEDFSQLRSLAVPYWVKQEVLENKPLNSDNPHIAGVPIQASESVVHESPKAYSDNISRVASKEALAESCTTYDQPRPVEQMMETLLLSNPEININKEHNRLPEEILDHRNQQVPGRVLFFDNTFSQPQTVLDSGNVKQTEMLPLAPEALYLQGSRPVESYEVAESPTMDNKLVYPQSKFGVHLLDSGEVGYERPAYSGTELSTVADGIPTSVEWGNHISRGQANVPGELETQSSNAAISSSLSPSKVKDQDASDSLFSNQDPWNLSHESHFPPPRPNKLLTKKDAFGKDPYTENYLVSAGESIKSMLLEDGVTYPLSNPTNFEHTDSSKGSAEDIIKQELKAVAEGVAASVFQSATPNSEPLVHGSSESAYDASVEEVRSKDLEMQHKAKLEDMKSKVSDKMSFGFRVSEGMGRLQIIKNIDLEELRELGSGTFGTVYHGKWRGTDVAIKRINDRCFAGKPSEQERMIDDFWNEAIKLADLHHPNVVAFYGVVLDGPGGTVATVTEYMVNGSLRNALQKNERGLDKRKRLMIAMDVAFGMEYLHGKNIVHFDLKSDNLLVNLRDPHRPICKVGDLGLSKVKCHTLISGGVRGTLPWMAPELLNGGNSLVSEKVDVFSYGIVMWELLTGEEPYADLHYGAIIGGIVSNTLRPPVPESCDPEWRLLMERCWSSEPSERPSFTDIANELRAMAAKIPPKGQNQTQQPPSAQSQVPK